MVDDDSTHARRGLHVVSVQAWRGRFADGSPDGLDAVVVEFGAEGGEVPPLILPAGSISGLARVLFEAARSETEPVGARGVTDAPVAEPVVAQPAAVEPGLETGPAGAEVAQRVPDAAPGAGGTEGPGPIGGETWARLLAGPRFPAPSLPGVEIPATPGVYAWLRDGRPVHLGRAKSKRGLRSRVGGDQLATDAELARGGFRRAVADHLGVAPSADRLDRDELVRVNDWIAGCEVVWLACTTSSTAADLEDALRREWDPAPTP